MQPLYANPVLPFLAQALADHIFRDYKTFTEIEQIRPPPKGFAMPLEILPEKLDLPVLQMLDKKGPNGKIRKSTCYGNRLAKRGHRAGFEQRVKVHDMRREALVKADGM